LLREKKGGPAIDFPFFFCQFPIFFLYIFSSFFLVPFSSFFISFFFPLFAAAAAAWPLFDMKNFWPNIRPHVNTAHALSTFSYFLK
jgi:hypothetical protein